MLWTLHYVCQKPYCIVSGPEIPIDAKPVQVVAVDALLSDEVVERAARAMNLEAGRQRGLAFEDDWDEIMEQERGGWRLCARAALAIASSENEVQS